MAIFWPTPGFKGRTFITSGFSTEGIFISASTVPHYGITHIRERERTEERREREDRAEDIQRGRWFLKAEREREREQESDKIGEKRDRQKRRERERDFWLTHSESEPAVAPPWGCSSGWVRVHRLENQLSHCTELGLSSVTQHIRNCQSLSCCMNVRLYMVDVYVCVWWGAGIVHLAT